MNFKEPVRASKIKKLDNELHIQLVKVNNGADTYCLKEDTRIEGPWEYGTKPIKRNSKVDWEEVKTAAISGDLSKIPADIFVKHYSNLAKIKKDHMVPVDKDHLRGIWIWGKTGVGKSRKARELFPNSYPKLCNKWWDGYQSQQTVIMDDIGVDHKCLGQQLKIWTDRYGFIMENKGGAMVDNYQWFIVTS